MAVVKCHLIFLPPVLDFIKESGRAWIMKLCEIAPSPRLLSSLVVICSSENQYNETPSMTIVPIRLHDQQVGHTPPHCSARGIGVEKCLCGVSAERF